MTRVAGIDGCRGGWVAVIADADRPQQAFLAHAHDILRLLRGEGVDFALVDMPIGFVDGPEPRDVDTAMRSFLKGKASSVFPTPCRAALQAYDYWDASEINEKSLARRLPKQTFMLFPKMREVDEAVREIGQAHLREGHPEVSFAILNGSPVLTRKREKDGVADRTRLLAEAGIPSETLLKSLKRGAMAEDDILDAAALFWSAARFVRDSHITFPPNPSRDSVGLEMSVIA